MADMNKVLLSGTVPYFDDAEKRYKMFNEGDEKKVHGMMKLNVQGIQKDEQGRPKSDIFDVTIWGKRAEALKKFNIKGKGLIFEGRLTPSRKRDDGTWTGMGFTAYDFYLQRTADDRVDSAAAPSAAPSAAPGIPAPAAPQVTFQAAPAAAAPAAPAAAVGSEDWPF